MPSPEAAGALPVKLVRGGIAAGLTLVPNAAGKARAGAGDTGAWGITPCRKTLSAMPGSSRVLLRACAPCCCVASRRSPRTATDVRRMSESASVSHALYTAVAGEGAVTGGGEPRVVALSPSTKLLPRADAPCHLGGAAAFALASAAVDFRADDAEPPDGRRAGVEAPLDGRRAGVAFGAGAVAEIAPAEPLERRATCDAESDELERRAACATARKEGRWAVGID